MRPLLLRNAEIDGARVDVRLAGGRVVAIDRDLAPASGDALIDCGGGALLPGLHDHHLHLLAMAAAAASVVVGPPAVADRHQLAAALRHVHGRLASGRWIRGIGYHDSVAGPLDREVLDELVADRPVRVQHRSGGLWVLNSAAVAAAGLASADDVRGLERDAEGRPTGRLWRLDWWLRDRVPHEPLDLAGVGERLLRWGVVGVTDATPTDDAGSLQLVADAVRTGDLPQRVVVTGAPTLDPDVAPELPRGPVKLLLPDHEPPSLDAVVAGVRAARAQGRAVAIHAVTAVAAVLALAAIEEVGPHPGDRVEHGAVLPVEVAVRLGGMGVTVVTNPGFVAERGDQYLAEVDPGERPDLWRCRSLLDAGVSVAAGTDAPFGGADPWAAMAAAVDRRTPSGYVLGPLERLAPAGALALFLSPLERPGAAPRRIAVGMSADLCLLATPLTAALVDLGSAAVAATLVGGVAHRW